MKEIIISRNNVNVNYEANLAAEIEKSRHLTPPDTAKLSMGMIIAFHKDATDLRRKLRVWAGVYDVADPRSVLDITVCDKLKSLLSKMGYRWNVTWQKANNPFTSVLIKEEDKR